MNKPTASNNAKSPWFKSPVVLIGFGVLLVLAFQKLGGPEPSYINRIDRLPMTADKTLGWAPRPNYSSYSPTFLTGEHGIRMNSDVIVPLEQNAVLAIGDSFTAGSEVGNDESFPAYLEKALKKQVNNAASGAWGVDQMVLRLEQLAPILRPKTVVIGILDQDILRNNYRLYGGGYKPYFVIENGELELRGTPVPFFSGNIDDLGFWRALLGHSYALDMAAQRFGYLPTWVGGNNSYIKAHDDGPKVSGLLMRRLASLREKYGFNVIVVLLYGRDAVTQYKTLPEWIEPTIQGAKENNIPLVNMLPILQGEPAERVSTFYVSHDDGRTYGHMSPEGNHFVAEAILARFRELNWDVSRPASKN